MQGAEGQRKRKRRGSLPIIRGKSPGERCAIAAAARGSCRGLRAARYKGERCAEVRPRLLGNPGFFALLPFLRQRSVSRLSPVELPKNEVGLIFSRGRYADSQSANDAETGRSNSTGVLGSERCFLR